MDRSLAGGAAGALSPQGSLFLNVGAKPTDPWTALDVAQAARRHLRLQNTIHWIKSIAIEKALAGARAGLADDLAVGHYKPINSRRFLHDCHEFVFHFTPGGNTPLDRNAVGVRYQDQSNVGRWQTAASGVRCRGNTWFIPYDTIQSREKDRPHPGHLSRQAARDVRAAARPRPRPHRGRPVHGPGIDRRGVRHAWAPASSASSSTRAISRKPSPACAARSSVRSRAGRLSRHDRPTCPPSACIASSIA